MRGRVPIFPVNRRKEKNAEAEDTRELTTKPASPMMLQRSQCRKRSIAMTSDAGFNSQDTDYARHIQEVLDELRQMQQSPQLVTSPEVKFRRTHGKTRTTGCHVIT